MLKQAAVTLVELLIALTLGVVVVAAGMAVFVASINHGRNSVEYGHLDTQLQLVMEAIARDVRRAGYWGSAGSSQTNPFTQAATDITVNASGNCVLMAYDNNGDGTLPAVNSGSDDERYGFRLMNGAIQFRPVTGTFSCSAAAANWTNLTDPNVVNVTTFTVVKNTSTEGTVELRTITVSITGQLVSNTAITKTLTQTIKVHNDKYTP